MSLKTMVSNRYIGHVVIAIMLGLMLGSVTHLQMEKFHAASGYVYPVVVTSTDCGENYYYIPILYSIDNDGLVENGYMDSDGLDTNMEVAGNKVLYTIANGTTAFVLPYLYDNSDSTVYYYLDYSPRQDSFDMISGVGGKVEIPDNEVLEPGEEDFSIEWKGYLDATTEGSIVEKDETYGLRIHDAGGEDNILVGYCADWLENEYLYPTSDIDVNLTPRNNYPPYTTPNHYALVDDPYDAADWNDWVDAASTPYIYDIYGLTDNVVMENSYLESVELCIALDGYLNNYTGRADLVLVGNTTEGTERIGEGTGPDYFCEVMDRPGGGDWQVLDLNDLGIKLNLKGLTSMCCQVYVKITYVDNWLEAEVDSGAHTIILARVNGTMSLTVDDVEEDSGNSTESLPNNSSVVEIDGDIAVGTEYVKIYTGNESYCRVWFQPNNIIEDTLIPNRSEIMDGTATAGSNTTLEDCKLVQDDDFWNNWRVYITSTTDGEAPQGEYGVISDYVHAGGELTFGALTEVVQEGDEYTLRGVANGGGSTYIDDDDLTQAEDYWNLWEVYIIETTDGEAPQGEHTTVTNFDATTNQLDIVTASFSANVESGDVYELRLEGVLTWGSNPGCISIEGGSITISNPASGGSTTFDPPAPIDIIPETGDQPDYYETTTGSNLPLYGLIDQLSTNMGIPISLIWTLLACTLAVAGGVSIYIFVPNLVVLAIVSGFILAGFVSLGGGIIPYWTLIIYGIIALTLIIMERVYSL